MTRTYEPLEDRLTRTMRAKAAQVQPGDTSFDVTVVPLVVDDGRRRRRRVRTALVAAALVAAIVAVSTTLVVTRRSSGPSAPPAHPSPDRVATPRVLPAVDAPVLVPATPPAGMQLWSIRTQPDRTVGSAVRTQLFGSVDAAGAPTRALLVEMWPGTQGRPPGSQSFTVRGHDASAYPSKDGGAAGTEIDWNEGSSYARVTIRGMSASDAAGVLNRLRLRTASLLDGFDPASAPSGLGLLGESVAPTTSGFDAVLAYGAQAPSPDVGPAAIASTSTHAAYPGYLRTWIAGSRGPDGVAAEFDRGFDVVVAWPDGRQVVVQTSARDATPYERSARTATVLGVDGVRAVKADVDARLARLPRLGALLANGWRVELHGAGAPQALCLVVPRAAPTCTVSDLQVTAAWQAGVVGSASVDGRWVVYGASPSPISLTQARSFPTREPQQLPLLGSATAAGWHLVLATVPPGVDQVQVSVSSGNESAGETLVRPRL